MRVGTAGWNIPAQLRSAFPEEGSHLSRYSKILNAVEINSTFYKFHQAKTFERWASETPDDFEFSIKLHQHFTHNCDLAPKVKDIKEFLRAVNYLGEKWKVLLVQFPGKMEYHEKKMDRFYSILRKNFEGHIVLEPRNLSWASRSSMKLMKEYKISKVYADPERCPFKEIDFGIHYVRLHGSPVIYRSSYNNKFIRSLSRELSGLKNSWVIFDNTTFGYATANALLLKSSISLGR